MTSGGPVPPGSVPGGAAGPLALVGGAEWRPGADFDAELLERSGGDEVVVLPTAAGDGAPKAVEWARRWFASLGGSVRGLMVLHREEAFVEENVKVVAGSRFLYLGGGSPSRLRSVFEGTPLFDALVAAWGAGAVVAGSSAGAMVLCDPMADPRGGVLTSGLGLVERLVVLPHHSPASDDFLLRTLGLVAPGVAVAGIPERTAVIREPDGSWRAAGASVGEIAVYADGEGSGLGALPR